MKFFAEDLNRYKASGRIDWSEPSLFVIAWYRLGQWGMSLRSPILRKVVRLVHLPVFICLTLLTGIHLPRGSKIGPGLRIYHFGGIIFNPDVVMGKGCTVRHGVTIGNRKSDHDVPVIGDHVDIGAGAKILGAIRVGNNASIGANAVVLRDVPDNHVAVGVPARVLPKTTVTAELASTKSATV